MNLDFCVVGPQRTGTTWIYETLLKHGSANLPLKVKETYFFDEKFSKGFDYYFSLFNEINPSKLTGEVAPTYFHQHEVIKQIAKHNKNCKIILIYRDPLEKAVSIYKHHLRKGRVNQDFEAGLKKYPEIIESGQYARLITNWQRGFGHENVLILKYSELKNNPQLLINKLTDYLSIKSILLSDEDRSAINSASIPRFPLLAKILTAVAVQLRKNDLHFIANAGKKIGLTKVYQGGKNKIEFTELLKIIESQFDKHDFLESRNSQEQKIKNSI